MRLPKHKLMEMIIPNDNCGRYCGLCTFVRYRAAAESESERAELYRCMMAG